MYHLTLSSSERSAMDWVGGRYWHGDDFYRLLWGNCSHLPESSDWDADHDILFVVPESVAWEIRERSEEDEYSFACFSDDFRSKLVSFLDKIV